MQAMIEVIAEDAAIPPLKGQLSTTCMVAKAMKRALPGRDIRVGITMASIGGRQFQLPAGVAPKISAYLEGKPVEPFSFSVEFHD